MPKPAFYLVAILSFLFCLPALAPADVGETLTITTYYPSPYGVYRELRSQRIAIGDNYIQSGTYDWETTDGDGGEIDYRADLVVQGNVGIGTVNPVAPLTVYYGTAGAPATSGSSDSTIAMRMHVGSIGLDFGTYANGTSWIQNRIYNNYASNYSLVLEPNGGNVGIGSITPTGKLEVFTGANQYLITSKSTYSDYAAHEAFLSAGGVVKGSITGNGAGAVLFNTTSDKRLKENIVDSKLGLNSLKQISVKDFNFISDPDKKITQGFIAQDLYNVYPYAVTVGGDDPDKNPWSVDYGRLTPLIVKSIQEQQNIIKIQQLEIDELKARLDKLEGK